MMRLLYIAALNLASLLAFPVMAQEFPLTIEHKFGATIIDEKPRRVASLDYNGADNLLALGVQPVTVRYWFGDYPRAVWPWADALLQGEPEILRGDLNFEQIAAADPDVIIAVYSGISEADYEKLSLIAPVVAVPEGVGDYELPWDQQALITVSCNCGVKHVPLRLLAAKIGWRITLREIVPFLRCATCKARPTNVQLVDQPDGDTGR